MRVGRSLRGGRGRRGARARRLEVGVPLAPRGRGGAARPPLGAQDPAQRTSTATAEDRIEAIAALRRLRMPGHEIASLWGIGLSTPRDPAPDRARKLSRLEPLESPNCYERQRARRADPHRRQEARPHSAARPSGHRQPPRPRYRRARLRRRRGSSCTSRSTTPPGSHASSAPCSQAGPMAPSTAHSTERQAALSGWLDFYTRRRPHGSLGHQAPIDHLTACGREEKPVGSYS